MKSRKSNSRMINYIRHDEQFYGTVKLITGEEILGEVLLSIDPESKEDLLFIQHPAKTKVIELDPNRSEDGEQKVAVGFIKWMNFSEEEFYVLEEKSVISIAPMSKDAIRMYKRWVKKEILHEPEPERGEIPMNKNMGLIAKVSSARDILEKIWNIKPGDPSNP